MQMFQCWAQCVLHNLLLPEPPPPPSHTKDALYLQMLHVASGECLTVGLENPSKWNTKTDEPCLASCRILAYTIGPHMSPYVRHSSFLIWTPDGNCFINYLSPSYVLESKLHVLALSHPLWLSFFTVYSHIRTDRHTNHGTRLCVSDTHKRFQEQQQLALGPCVLAANE